MVSFARFSDRARKVVATSRSMAVSLGSKWVTAHHVAAALPAAGGLATAALAALNRDRVKIESQAMLSAALAEKRSVLDHDPAHRPDFDDGVRRMFDKLAAIAEETPSGCVGTAQILAGLCTFDLPYLKGIAADTFEAAEREQVTTFEQELEALIARFPAGNRADLVARSLILTRRGYRMLEGWEAIPDDSKPENAAREPEKADRPAVWTASADPIPHTFKTGDQVRLCVPAGHAPKYNPDEMAHRRRHHPYGVGVVVDPPNEGFPVDAVQVRFPGNCDVGGGEGAVEACCLVKIDGPCDASLDVAGRVRASQDEHLHRHGIQVKE